ncbi:MAG TPA: PKD domain-containing protein [Vicinamibacterales bacterium]|nr:PKD domain-containing protein [Vicinamibacterales bacterium]
MRKSLLAVSALSAVLATSCTVHNPSTPALSGPSGLALSLQLSATPDSVLQDGSSRSTITVAAFNQTGSSVAQNVQLTLNGPGLLSATTIQTPSSVTYTPPATTSGTPVVVTVSGTIVGTNGASSVPGPQATPQVQLTIRPATVLAATAPFPQINVIPASSVYAAGQMITFDASASCGTQLVAGACPGTIAVTGATWNFGDGTSATGSVVGHQFSANGTFPVTLAISNGSGGLASTTTVITVATVAAPTSAFTVSPASIPTGLCNPYNAFFNAATSTAAPGHSIVQYDWNFGDGVAVTTNTPSAAHCYTLANTYNSTLTVTDDVGQKATSSVSVTAK